MKCYLLFALSNNTIKSIRIAIVNSSSKIIIEIVTITYLNQQKTNREKREPHTSGDRLVLFECICHGDSKMVMKFQNNGIFGDFVLTCRLHSSAAWRALR